MADEDLVVSETNYDKLDRRSGVMPGIILIILGVLFSLPKFGLVIGNLWPLFFLAPGLAGLIFYSTSTNKVKNAGLLFLNVIITLISVFLLYLNLTNWEPITVLWPIFPIILGLSFYTFYFGSGRRERGVLIPANILLGIGLIFLVMNILSFDYWPLLLIMVGLYVILAARGRE